MAESPGAGRQTTDHRVDPDVRLRDDASTEVLTIDEATAILRISSNAAYAAARQWRTSETTVGPPVVAAVEHDPPPRALRHGDGGR